LKWLWDILSREIRFQAKDPETIINASAIADLRLLLRGFEAQYLDDWRSTDERLDEIEKYSALLATLSERLNPLEQNYGFLINSHEVIGKDLNLVRATSEYRYERSQELAAKIFARIDNIEAIALQNTKLIKELMRIVKDARARKIARETRSAND
jgi:hypothetical protein